MADEIEERAVVRMRKHQLELDHRKSVVETCGNDKFDETAKLTTEISRQTAELYNKISQEVEQDEAAPQAEPEQSPPLVDVGDV